MATKHRAIALTNQKGGCGKTTTAASLAGALALEGYRVALVDMDSQCNATASFGLRPDELVDRGQRTVADMLLSDRGAIDCLVELGGRLKGNLVVVPGHRGLSSVPQRLESELQAVMYSGTQSDLDADDLRRQHRYRLRNSLATLSPEFDVVVIDTPPELGFLLTASLLASNYYLIPLKPSGYDLSGLDSLVKTVRKVKKGLNPELECAGVLQTMVDGRATLDRQIRDLLISKFGDDLVFNSVINTAVAHRQTTVEGKVIFELDPQSKGAQQYRAFAHEVIDRMGLHVDGKSEERVVELSPAEPHAAAQQVAEEASTPSLEQVHQPLASEGSSAEVNHG